MLRSVPMRAHGNLGPLTATHVEISRVNLGTEVAACWLPLIFCSWQT